VTRATVLRSPTPISSKAMQPSLRQRPSGDPCRSVAAARNSSAHRSNVQPLSRSKRAWCQWTGQDAVLDASPVERKAHVRATIVEGEGATAVVDDKDGPVTPYPVLFVLSQIKPHQSR